MQVPIPDPLSPSLGNEFLGEYQITTPLFPSPPPPQQQQKFYTLSTKIMLEEQLPKGCKISNKKRRLATRINHFSIRNPPVNLQEQTLDIQRRRREKIEEKRRMISEKRVKREAYIEEMKQINKNYQQFYKEYKRIKPLYSIKEEEYKRVEEMETLSKRNKVLNKLKELHKPIDMNEIKEHQKAYIQNKLRVQPSMYMSPSEIGLIQNRRYYRGRSHDIILEEFKEFKDKFKQKEYEGVAKMKQYCQEVVAKVKNKMVEDSERRRKREENSPGNPTSRQGQVLNKRHRSYTEPDKTERTPILNSRGKDSSVYEKINPEIEGRLKSESEQRHSRIWESPKIKGSQRKRVIRDRYDLEQLIYQNQRRDLKIHQHEQLVKLGKKPKIEQQLTLQDDYVDSIKQKINILAARC